MKMKFIILLAFGVTFTLQTTAQNQISKKVPEKVLTAFQQKFPSAQKVKWEMENESEWEAEFKINKIEYSANFLTDGTWVETEYEAKKADLPENILAILTQNFKGYELEEIEVVETPAGTGYELEIEVDEEEFYLEFDPNGKLVNEKEIEDDED